jgi:hypothetical protein
MNENSFKKIRYCLRVERVTNTEYMCDAPVLPTTPTLLRCGISIFSPFNTLKHTKHEIQQAKKCIIITITIRNLFKEQ